MHHCEIFEMNGESYRFRESMKEKQSPPAAKSSSPKTEIQDPTPTPVGQFSAPPWGHFQAYLQQCAKATERTMGVTFLIIGLLFLVSIGFDIAKGRIRIRGGYFYRSAVPVLFWLVIALKCTVPVFAIFPKQCLSFVQFGIEDTSADTQRKVREFQQRNSAEPGTSREQK